ncbi:MAG: DUF3991 domain-containing protein, partial [Sphingobacteriia bacterium]|nr:DUF3991 domain-containing protein [Sphingobacteriia bacterium]
QISEFQNDMFPDLSYVLPARRDNNWERVFTWLTEVRKLAKDLVQMLYDQGLVYADKYFNAVFVHLGDCGAEVHGTGKKWKGSIGKKTGFYVEPTSADLIPNTKSPRYIGFTESALDAVALVQLHPKLAAVATGGSNFRAVEDFVKMCDVGTKLYACQDADEAGEKQAERCVAELGMVRARPAAKDYNALLIKKLEEEEAQREKEKLEKEKLERERQQPLL